MEELCHKVYQSPRLRRVTLKPNSINLIGKQENPLTTKACREVTVKPAAATLTLESRASLVLQSKNRTRIAEKQSQRWFSSSRTTRTRIFFLQVLNKTEESTFSEVEEVDHRYGQYRDPRGLRNLFQNAPIVLCFEKSALCTAHVEEEQLGKKNYDASSVPRYVMKSTLRHQKESLPWWQTWCFRTGTKVQQGQGGAAGSSPNQACWLQYHFGKMSQGWQIPKVFTRHWVDWGTHHSVRRTRIGRPLILQQEERTRNEKNWVLLMNKEGVHDNRRILVPIHRPVFLKKCARRNRHCQSTPRTEATYPDCRIFSLAERD